VASEETARFDREHIQPRRPNTRNFHSCMARTGVCKPQPDNAPYEVLTMCMKNECFTTTCRCMAIHLQVARAREEAHPTGPSWLPSAEPQVSREDAMRTLRALAEGTHYEGPERRQHLVGLTDIDSALALTLEPGVSRTREGACLITSGG
jgi:hypothetical protein